MQIRPNQFSDNAIETPHVICLNFIHLIAADTAAISIQNSTEKPPMVNKRSDRISILFVPSERRYKTVC